MRQPHYSASFDAASLKLSMEATSIIDTASFIGAASLIYATFLRIEDISPHAAIISIRDI